MKNFFELNFYLLQFDYLQFGTVVLVFVFGLLLSFVTSKVLVNFFYKSLASHLTKTEGSRLMHLEFLMVCVGWFWYFGFRMFPVALFQNFNFFIIAKGFTYLGITLMIWKSGAVVQGKYMRSLKNRSSRIDVLLAPVISKFVHIIAVVFAVLSLADLIHFPMASLLTGLGLGGFAIAMAAKETVSNLFGSMAILFDRSFQIGDWIKVGDVEGNVESVGLRSTRIRTFYDSIVILPNATLITANVENMGERKSRRFRTSFHLAVASQPELVNAFCTKITDWLTEQPDIKKESVQVCVIAVLPNLGIQVQLTCFFNLTDGKLEIQRHHDVQQMVLNLAKSLGVTWHTMVV